MEKSILKDILDDSKKNKKFLSFRLNDGDRDFYCGYVSSYNEILIEIVHYTKYGKCDGVKILRLEDVLSVDYDNDYSHQMKYLVENTRMFDNIKPVHLSLPKVEAWQYEILKEYVGTEEHVLQFDINLNDDDSIMGFILRIDEEYILIRQINNWGVDDGPILHRLDNITSIRIDDMFSTKAKLLYKWRKNR